jgi:DNA-binding transcriptional LysR family regulator
MTITQLKYFLALAETLNFSKVAEQFYVAQTAISYNIKAMETELGVALFVRNTKRVALTDAGRSFYTRVKPAVQIIDQAQSDLSSDTAGGTMVIGCSELCFGPTLLSAIDRFTAAHANVRLNLVSDEPELTLVDKLTSGRVDAAIFLRTRFFSCPANAVLRDAEVRVTRKIFCARSHPFAGCTGGVPAERLSRETFVSYGDMEHTRQLLPSPFSLEETDSSIRSALVTDSFGSMLAAVRANLGIACLPLLHDLRGGDICTVPCLETPPGYPVLSVMHLPGSQTSYQQDFIRIYLDAVKEYFSSHTEIIS